MNAMSDRDPREATQKSTTMLWFKPKGEGFQPDQVRTDQAQNLSDARKGTADVFDCIEKFYNPQHKFAVSHRPGSYSG